MNTLFTSTSNRQLPTHARRNTARLLAGVLLIVGFVSLAANSVAAARGEWGRTSTATAKITLRILPDNYGQSVRSVNYLATEPDVLEGYSTLQAYCEASVSFNRAAGLFSANLVTVDSKASERDLDSWLRASCKGHDPAHYRALTAAQGHQQTILISPI